MTKKHLFLSPEEIKHQNLNSKLKPKTYKTIVKNLSIILILLLIIGTYQILQRPYKSTITIAQKNYNTHKQTLLDFKQTLIKYKEPESNILYKFLMTKGKDIPIINIYVKKRNQEIENLIKSYIKNSQNIDKDKLKAIKAFAYLNFERKRYGRQQLEWDERAYNLALYRSIDMVSRNYIDHTTPEGTCVKDIQIEYGFKKNEELWENILGIQITQNGKTTVLKTYQKNRELEGMKDWFQCRGHRYNNFYPTHTKGAMACYGSVCTFFGITEHNKNINIISSTKCHTGQEGLDSWKKAPPQEYEI